MAYKVYYGTLDSVTAIPPEYCWVTRTLIYDTTQIDDDSLLMFDPVLKRESNSAGSFEADIPITNVCWNNLSLILGTIEIERDGEIIWQGRITTIEVDFDLNKHIYAEGELAYLNDRWNFIDWNKILVEYDNDGSTDYLCYWDIFFNNYCGSTTIGNGKEIYTNMGVERDGTLADWMPETAYVKIDAGGGAQSQDERTVDTPCMSSWSALTTVLLDTFFKKIKNRIFFYIKRTKSTNVVGDETYQRELRFSYVDENGDVLCGEMPLTSQTVEFGKNLTDIHVTYDVSIENLVTNVIAQGYAKKGWWIFQTTDLLYGHARNDALIQKYGVIEKYDYVDGTASTQSYLNVKAAKELSSSKDYDTEVSEIEVSAIDLYYSGEATDHLDFMKRSRIISAPHGIDMILPCTKMEEHLDDPSKNVYTFGRKKNSISSFTSSNEISSERANAVGQSVKSYVTNTAKEV